MNLFLKDIHLYHEMCIRDSLGPEQKAAVEATFKIPPFLHSMILGKKYFVNLVNTFIFISINASSFTHSISLKSPKVPIPALLTKIRCV